ncbi:ABC transporter permease [bacterium]|nr:MAG: ABC transporter permease [bacterium]
MFKEMLCELWLSQRYFKSGKKERIISLTAFISTLGIAIGVLVLIVVIAVMSGFDRYLEDKMVGVNSHMFLEFYHGLRHPDKVINELKKVTHVQAAAPFLAGQALIKIGQQLVSVDVRGIDPKLQPQVTKIKEYMKEGSFNLEGNEAVIGEELASRLGANIGDTIGLISPLNLNRTDFRIKGVFNSGMYLYDAGLILTTIRGAQDLFGLKDLVSGVALKTDDLYRLEAVKQDIYKKVGAAGQYEIRTWADANRNFLHALKLEKTVMFIVVTMTTVVAAFGIVSTLIMSVMSRVRDIGILRSIGAKTASILEIFIFQGLSIGVTGIILGLIGGIALAFSLNNVVDFISRISGKSLIPRDIYYFDRIPTNINSADITFIVFSALGISLLASIYPAYYAARILPSDAVRHE